MKTEIVAVNTSVTLETQTAPGRNHGDCDQRYLLVSGKVGDHRIEISISQKQFDLMAALLKETADKQRTQVKAEVWITKETPNKKEG